MLVRTHIHLTSYTVIEVRSVLITVDSSWCLVPGQVMFSTHFPLTQSGRAPGVESVLVVVVGLLSILA